LNQKQRFEQLQKTFPPWPMKSSSAAKEGIRFLQPAYREQRANRVADSNKGRFARNEALIARMGVPPTREQVLDEIELEIVDAMRLSEAADFPVLMRALWAVRTELLKLRQRPDS
jgi:hypothetical protein